MLVMRRTDTSKTITSLGLCVCLVLTAISPVSPVAATAPPPPTRPDAAEETVGARQFDEAVNELEKILSLDLTTEKGARESSKILEKNVKKLALADKKALNAARKVSAFSEGVKAEAAKRKGGMKELVEEIKAKPEKVMEIAGAQEAARTVQESTRRAGEVVQKVSEAFQKAADSLKEKQQSGLLRGAVLLGASYERPLEEAGEPVRYAKLVEGAEMKLTTGKTLASTSPPDIYCMTNPTCLALFLIVTGMKLTTTLFQKCPAGINAAYSYWQSCSQTRWWDIAFCNYQFLSRVKQACSFI